MRSDMIHIISTNSPVGDVGEGAGMGIGIAVAPPPLDPGWLVIGPAFPGS